VRQSQLLFRNLGYGLAGFVLSVLVMEAILRAIESTPAWRILPVVEREPGWPDPHTGYTLRAGRSLINVREHRARVTTNSFGMRDRERTLVKPVGTFRVAVTGDSFTEALQVADDATFTRLAERQLDDAGLNQRFEILNLGMSGAGPVQQLLAARRVAAFAPDAVVMLLHIDQLQHSRMSDDTYEPAYVAGSDGSVALGYAFRERTSQRYRDATVGRLFFMLMDHSRVARAVYLYVSHRGVVAAGTAPDRPLPCARIRAQQNSWLARWSKQPQNPAADVLEAWLRDLGALGSETRADMVLLIRGLGEPRTDCPGVADERGTVWQWIGDRTAAAGVTIIDADAEIAALSRAGGSGRGLTGFGRAEGSGHLNHAGHAAYARLLGALTEQLSRR